MVLDDMQPVAERNHPAHPYALFLRGGDLVANPLAGVGARMQLTRALRAEGLI
jgi:hypothetical protein